LGISNQTNSGDQKVAANDPSLAGKEEEEEEEKSPLMTPH
jgi:hypothetical protein